MKKILLALALTAISVQAHKRDRLDANVQTFGRYLDCKFCGMMSLPKNEQVPQLKLLKEALEHPVRSKKSDMHPVTQIIYYGITEIVKHHDFHTLINLVDRKIASLSGEVVLQRSSQNDPRRPGHHQKPRSGK
jgi:hypothetical protein